MSYYARYQLNVRQVKEPDIDLIDKTLKEKDLIRYVFDEEKALIQYNFDGKNTFGELEYSPWEEQIWDEHQKVMLDISKQFPELVFRLTCLGEDNVHCREYYQNGRTEYCYGYVVYDDPEEIAWPR